MYISQKNECLIPHSQTQRDEVEMGYFSFSLARKLKHWKIQQKPRHRRSRWGPLLAVMVYFYTEIETRKLWAFCILNDAIVNRKFNSHAN